MALEADFLVDRRRLKRHLTWWRALAIAALVGAAIAAFGRFQGFQGSAYIARYAVDGIIVDDTRRLDTLADIAKDDDAKALIVHIDSPGGTVVGGESLFRSLRKVAASKPVVAVMGELATSAGYMTAIAADHIVARAGTITGSIGVIMQTTEITGLLKKLGITTEAIKSGPLKAAPSPLEPMTEPVRAALREMIADTHELFLSMVAERRKLTGEALARVGDGRVLTGRRALEARLIDAIGGEDEAIAWLEQTRGLPADLPVREIEDRERFRELFRRVTALGEKTIFSERLTLDGLVSVWHPWSY